MSSEGHWVNFKTEKVLFIYLMFGFRPLMFCVGFATSDGLGLFGSGFSRPMNVEIEGKENIGIVI